MFTGIITDIGTIKSVTRGTGGEWGDTRMDDLERALTGKDEMGGHLVTGHVDGVGTLISLEEIAGSHKLRLEAPQEMAFGIAPKGSITIDGVSLTVNDVENNQFDVNIIPHTWQVTTLGKLGVGSKVNLEIDLIARYVARYLAHMKA